MSNALFFTVEDAAREIGVSAMDVIWSYSKKNIQGQQIQTVNTFADSLRFTSDQIVAAVRSGQVYEDRKRHFPFEKGDWPAWFQDVAGSDERRKVRKYVEDKMPKQEKAYALKLFMDQHGFDPTNRGEQYRRYDSVEKSHTVLLTDYKRFITDSIQLGRQGLTDYESAVSAFLKDSKATGSYSGSADFASCIEAVLVQETLDTAKKMLGNTKDARYQVKGFLTPSPLLRLCAMQDHERRQFMEDCFSSVKSRLHEVTVRQSFGFIRDGDVSITLTVPSSQIYHDALIRAVVNRVF
jgi:hypothetical protein